ncbi:TRAF3-interacting protein 1 isoform 7-T8 [Megaptera novaeangliae]
MNAAVVKRTQEALGKVIRRPPLTEKLLNKPPFRYLHDIITEVIRTTGFMKGLYTDAEMKSDNVKDKDTKISFLQKAIDVVVMVSGEPLLAKPARIVAGHEPERTNELLQRIGKCCLNKLSSDDAVKRVLAGEKAETKGRSSLTSKPQELDNKNVREEASRVPKDKADRRNSEINERNTSGGRKQKEELKDENKPREKERDREKPKENDRDRHKDPERDKYHEGERERAKNRARPERDRAKDAEREREPKNEGGKEKEKRKERERERERDGGRDRQRARNGQHGGDPDREKSHERDKPEKKSSSSGEMSKKSSDGSFKDSKAETETEISTRASRSVTTKTSKRRSKNSVEGRRDSRTSENSLSPEKELNSSSSKAKKEHTGKQLGRKEDDISAKILDPIVSGLNNEPDQETTTSEIGTKEANTHSASVSDANSSSLQRESAEPEPAVKQKGDSPSDAEGDVGPSGQEKCEVPENSELPGELPAAVRRIPRPGSARPAPPRVRRQESAEVLTSDRTGSGKTISNVIVESQNSDNEDDDQFVVEAAPQLSEVLELEMVQAVELEDEKHDELVHESPLHVTGPRCCCHPWPVWLRSSPTLGSSSPRRNTSVTAALWTSSPSLLGWPVSPREAACL